MTSLKNGLDTPKKVIIGNDPWSLKFLYFLHKTPHYKTGMQWESNINIPLQSTFYYQWLKGIFNAEGSVWNGILKTEEDIIRQCNNFKDMFLKAPVWDEEDIIKHAVVAEVDHYYGFRPVKIVDNGELVIWDGMHRLSLLAVKNLPIEVTICERSDAWQRLYSAVEKLYPNNFLYQPIPHPDFSDWKIGINKKKERILREFFQKHSFNTVLDLGTCHGFTLYELRDLISHGIGVEENKTRSEVASTVLNRIGFDCYNDNIVNYIKTSDPVECTLCCAVFHHVSRSIPMNEFETFLKTLAQKTKYLIYTLPNSNEDQFQWMYESKRDTFHEYILKLTGFKIHQVFNSDVRQLIILRRDDVK